MPRQKKVSNEQQVSLGLAEGLRNAVKNPSIDRYKPHYKQQLFHKSTKPGRQFIGGNRSGKTVGGATEIIWYARGQHPYKRLPWSAPLRLRVVTVDLLQGLDKIILPEIKKWLAPSDLVKGSWEESYSKQHRTLTLANGSFIEFMTHEQDLDSFAGTSRHGVWFDEEPPKDIFTECKLRLLDTEGHWWMTMTPVEGMTWTFDDIYEKRDPYVDIIEVDMDENPHLTETGKAIALSGLNEEEIKARKHGKYVSLGGTIYEKTLQSASIIPSVMPPIEWLWVAAMDHGFTNPTAWLWAATDETGRIIVFDEYYKAGEIVSVHARKVHEINLERHDGRVPDYIVGDPSIRNRDPITGTSVLLEYQENGIDIMLGNNDVHAGIDRVKKLMVGRGPDLPMLFITENCTNLLWELKRYRYDTWRHKNDQYAKNKKEDPFKKDDHACDALRYLVASRPEVEPSLPQNKPQNPINSSYAVDESGLRDRGLLVPTRQPVDFELGDDF